MATSTASYSVTGSTNSLSFTITPDPAYPYYYIFIRYKDDVSSKLYGAWHTVTYEQTITITGMPANTQFAVNVDFSPDKVTGWGQLGAQFPSTSSSGGGGGGGATTTTPYMWTYSGLTWYRSVAWVSSGGAWYMAKPWAYQAGWYQGPST